MALRREFPPWVLSLSMQVHCAARAFNEGQYVSGVMRPAGISLLAGCGGAISYTRSALYDILDHMHGTYGPACNIHTYVDDVPQIHTGEAATITEQAVEWAVKLVQLLADDGYKVSEKSTLVASDPEIGRTIRN